MTLPLRTRGRFWESDILRGSCETRSVISATSASCGICGGVEAAVSGSLDSSLRVCKLAPLLRGLDSALMSCRAMLANGVTGPVGSHGIGLLGWLEEQSGMLVCRCGGIVEEKEFRLMNGCSV